MLPVCARRTLRAIVCVASAAPFTAASTTSLSTRPVPLATVRPTQAAPFTAPSTTSLSKRQVPSFRSSSGLITVAWYSSSTRYLSRTSS